MKLYNTYEITVGFELIPTESRDVNDVLERWKRRNGEGKEGWRKEEKGGGIDTMERSRMSGLFGFGTIQEKGCQK